MNSFAPQILLLLLAACSCLAALPPPVGCSPGSRKLEGFRSCVCSRLAVWECYQVGYQHHHHHRRDVDSQLESLKCEPGAVWQQECNRCYCTDLGYAACTKKKCIDRPRIERGAPSGEKLHGLYCKPGESWHDGCNSCFCTEAGATKCTTRHCPIDKYVGHKHKRSAPGPLGKECEPGKSWYDGCNHCACTETGLAICTLRYCEFQGESKGPIRTKREVQGGSNRCVPGTTWIASHMECHCTEDGATICHLLHRPPMAFPSKSKRSAIGGGQECTPGTTWKEDCNSCGCDERGEAYCTDMACNHPDPARITRETHGNCRPGTTWHEDCNTCGCDQNGNVYCTAMLCLPGMNPKAKREAEEDEEERCNPGDRWTEECNRCVCSRTGEPICTRMSCHPHPVELKSKRSVSVSPGGEVKCDPGDTWWVDCWTRCACTADGKPDCSTGTECVKVHRTKRNLRKGGRGCTPGDSWTDECGNRCSCGMDGGAVCTAMGCLRPKRSTQEARVGCKEGDTWMEDCNYCTCSGDGLPACTKKRCNPTFSLEKHDGNQIRCTPGETFMMDCNTCRCGPDGKTAGCTYMFCPPGLKPKIP